MRGLRSQSGTSTPYLASFIMSFLLESQTFMEKNVFLLVKVTVEAVTLWWVNRGELRRLSMCREQNSI